MLVMAMNCAACPDAAVATAPTPPISPLHDLLHTRKPALQITRIGRDVDIDTLLVQCHST